MTSVHRNIMKQDAHDFCTQEYYENPINKTPDFTISNGDDKAMCLEKTSRLVYN